MNPDEDGGPGDDFASLLKEARSGAGMTQTELASRSRLTGAYISQLEGRKKPPPSDEVVRRIAQALKADADALLEAAHLEKIPQDVRRKVRLLDLRLTRQRKITRTLLGDMLPLTLFNFLRAPAHMERASRTRRIGSRGRALLARLQEEIGPVESFREFRKTSRRAIDGLKEEERDALVETLEAMTEWEGGVPAEKPAEAETVKEIPVFDAPPAGSAEARREAARGFLAVADSRWKESRYALAVAGDEMHPRFEKGDLVVLDEHVMPRNGDIVAATLEEGGWMLGRYMKLAGEIEIAPANPRFPPLRFPRARGKPKPYTLRGTAIEVIRRLR